MDAVQEFFEWIDSGNVSAKLFSFISNMCQLNGLKTSFSTIQSNHSLIRLLASRLAPYIQHTYNPTYIQKCNEMNIYFNNLSSWFSLSIAIENTFAASLSDLADAFRDFSLQKLISCWIEWIPIANRKERWKTTMAAHGFTLSEFVYEFNGILCILLLDCGKPSVEPNVECKFSISTTRSAGYWIF